MATSIRVAQPGYSVGKCPDWAYLFNSDWAYLNIAYETTITLNAGSSTGVTVNHNLGYYPLVNVWVTSNGVNYGRMLYIKVNQNTVTVGSGLNPSSLGVSSLTCVVRCYGIDISKNIDYPLPISVQAKLPYNNQFGIKIAKTSRSINSTNLNDFILHSRAQSPAVLTVATETSKYYQSNYLSPARGTSGPAIVYPLKTSYLPYLTGALFDGTNYIYTSLSNSSLIGYDQTNNIVSLAIGSTGKGSFIIMRDPLFYPNTVQVIY